MELKNYQNIFISPLLVLSPTTPHPATAYPISNEKFR